MVKGTEDILVQVQVSKSGKVHSSASYPFEIEVQPRKKLVTIWPLFTIAREKEGARYELRSLSEYY